MPSLPPSPPSPPATQRSLPHVARWSRAETVPVDDISTAETIPLKLMQACTAGDAATISSWLDDGGHVDARWNEPDGSLCGSSLLMAASYEGRVLVVHMLIERGASLDLHNSVGVTALMCAAGAGYPSVVGKLLTAGAQLGLRDAQGWTALRWAVNSSRTFCVRAIQDHLRAIPTVSKTQEGDVFPAAIAEAAKAGEADAVVAWLDSGGHIDATWELPSGSYRGATLLMCAASYGHVRLCDLLIDYNASLDLQDSNGINALMSAAAKAHAPVVRLLLQKGASLAQRDAQGWTELTWAQKGPRHSRDRAQVVRMIKSRLQEKIEWRIIKPPVRATATELIARGGSSSADAAKEPAAAGEADCKANVIVAQAETAAQSDEQQRKEAKALKKQRRREAKEMRRQETEALAELTTAAGTKSALSADEADAAQEICEAEMEAATEAAAEIPLAGEGKLSPRVEPKLPETPSLPALRLSRPASVDLDSTSMVPAAPVSVYEVADMDATQKELGLETEDGCEPPDEFVCSIMHELMQDPVIASDGHTYERKAIMQWMKRKATSPKSGEPLELNAVFPNHAMRRQIREWQEANRR